MQMISKPYWSILNTFLNNKKLPILPHLFHEKEFVMDFKSKLTPGYVTLPKKIYQA